MKKRNLFIGWLPLIFFTACVHSSDGQKKQLTPIEVTDGSYKIDMYFAKPPWSEKADSLFLRFRIVDTTSVNNNKKVFWANLKKDNFEIRESEGNPPNNEIIPKVIDEKQGKKADRFSQNIVFWFMVDRSKTIQEEDIKSMKDAIQKTVENLPDSSVYISFFDNQTSDKKVITKNNFETFEKEFITTQHTKNLYQSIFKNFEEFVTDPGKKDANKYLLVFTDGKIDENSLAEVLEVTQWGSRVKEMDEKTESHTQIHAFRYGNDLSADQALNSICKTHRKQELKGGFYSADDIAGVIESFNVFVDDLSADYELTLLNHSNKEYNGTKLTLQVIITHEDGKKAVGVIQYAPKSRETSGKREDVYLAIIFGIFVLFIAFFIMQAGIPYFIYLVTNFEEKYVKSYEPVNDVYDLCLRCAEPFEKGDRVVVKCAHKIHWDCWKENGYKCVEYGQHCKDGIQYYFDKKHPFDLKKSPYYMKWAMSGLISGFFIWIIFRLTLSLHLFSGFIDRLLNIFYPDKFKVTIEGVSQISNDVTATFHSKIGGFLLVGILLGFVLTFLFVYINEFRLRKGKVLFSIFIRAFMGAVIGFISFLIGSIVCILLGAGSNVAYIDAIPWLLFGGGVAYCIAYKTTIKEWDALIGGLISGIISFFVLYTTNFFPAFGATLGFMLCSAGLGISIVAKHHAAQKYFLHYKGERKEGKIAIHKWMNESGGSNEVSIGKSNHCIIQMNWDNSDKIHNMQVKLYIDPKRKIPVLKVLEPDMMFDGREAHVREVYLLRNGLKFKIGNTEFQYIEK